MSNLRKDMNPEFMWDFSHIFATREDWEKAYTEAEEAIAALAGIAGTLCESAESLAAGLNAIYISTRLCTRTATTAIPNISRWREEQ